MEQINLLRIIFNSINNNINQGIISKILILICFLVYYGYFAINFLYGDGYRYKETYFIMSLGLFCDDSCRFGSKYLQIKN